MAKPSKKNCNPYRTNICFDCKNAYGGCSWTEVDPITERVKFVPVPGWTAEPIMRHINDGHKTYRCVGYHITACPKFVQDEGRKKGS